MSDRSKQPSASLSESLPGSWLLESRIDMTASGERRPEPMLGEDPVALLIYDRSGHFAAQFMKRDRTAQVSQSAVVGNNNSRAVGGYDAYFGTYVVDNTKGTVTQRLLAALSPENVGAVLTREAQVHQDRLIIRLETNASDGSLVTRTLTFRRVGYA